MITPFRTIALIAALMAGALLAQETSVTIPEGAAKYHSALVKRPNGGYLFDRFYNAWLDTGTLDGLKSFLQSKADAPTATTGDRLLLAYFHAKQNQDAEALAVFEKALAADQGNAEAWFEQAKIHARVLDFERALASLAKADAAKPKAELAAEMGQFKGRMLMRAGRVEEGLKAWQDLLAAQPGDEELQEDLIELLLTEGLLDQAIAASQKLIEQTPDPYQKVTRRMRLGDIYQRSGRREEALKTYGENLAASGQDSWMEKEVLTQLERVFRREDDLAGWKKYLTEQAAAQPQRVALQERLATVQAELNETDGAIATYAGILKLTPGDRTRREAFIQLLARLKKHAEAVEQMKALRALFPDDADMLAQLAIQEQAAGQKDAARASVLAYLEKSDHSEYAHLRAGQLLEEFKDPGAEEIYTKLVAAFPDSIGAKEAQAAYLHRAGKKEGAIAIWKALAGKGTGQDALRAAQALASRGEKQAAYEILKARAAEFNNDFVFLGQLVTAAIAVDQHKDAGPWVEQRVRLATNPTDLMDAIRQAATVLAKIENPEAFLAKLRDKKDRTATESCLLAELLEQNLDYEAAEAVLRPSIEAGDPLGLSQLVRLLETRGQPDAAAAAMLKLTQLPGNNNSSNLQRLVTLQRRALKFDDALRTVESWRQLVPGAAAPWREEANVLADAGRMDQAVAVLRRAAQRFEGQEEIRVQLAQFYANLGKYSEAERIYWTLYEAAEDTAGKLTWVTQLAQAAKARGLTKELVEQFEERRRNNRTSMDPLLAMAEIYKQDNNFEERRKVLLDATRLRPEDVSILHEIARIEEEEGEWQRSLETLETAARLDQTDGTRRRIARTQLSWGDPEEGFRLVRELAGGDQMDAAGALSLADALIVNGGWERVVEFITPQAERFPDDYRLTYMRAIALEESFQEEAARDLFMRLVTWKTEVPNPVASTNPLAQMSSMMSKMYGRMPDSTMDLILMMQNSMQAYYHQQILRQQGMRFSNPYYQNTGGMTRYVFMPSSLTDLRTFSLAHLRTLSQSLPPEKIKELAATLKQNGVESAEIALRFAAEQAIQGRMQALPEDLLKDYPDHLGLQAFFVLMGMNSLQGEPTQVNVAQLRHSYEALKKDYPETAFMAALVAAGSGAEEEGEGKSLLDQALKELPKFDSPTGILRYAVPLAMGAQGYRQVPSRLPARFQQPLLTMLLEWRASDLKDPSRTANAMNVFGPIDPISSVLRSQEDPTAYFNYLQEEIASFQPGPQNASMAQTLSRYFGSSSQNSLELKPLEFPPSILPDFPPGVLMQFSEMERNFGMTPLDPAKLAGKLEVIKDPVLKAIAAYRAEKKEVTRELVDQWLSAPAENRPGARELVLAAAYLGKEGEPARAALILEEVRQRPLAKNVRQRVDAALAGYVVELGDKAEAPVKEAGRQALLRLRYGLTNAVQRQEVATAMTALGLEKEAEQLTALNSTASPVPGMNLPSLSIGSGNTELDRLRKLAASGDETKVTEMALNLLKRCAKSMVSPSQTNLDYNLMNFVRNLDGLLSKDKIVAAAGEPGPTPAQRLEHAALLDLLGRRKEAIPHFEAGLKDGGRTYDGLRVRLAFMKAVDDPAAGAASLAALEKADFSQAGNQMSMVLQMQQYSNQRQNLYLKFAEMTALWLEKLDPARMDTLRAEWVNDILRYVQQGMNVGQEYVPALLSTSPQPDKDAARTRRALHDRLCLAMQKAPALARNGFKDWATLAVPEAKTEADWTKLDAAARAVMTQIGRQKRSAQPFQNTVYYNSSSQGERSLMEWPPDEYLIWRAYAKGGANARAEAEGVVAETTAWPREQQVTAKNFLNLYFSPPDQFTAAADAYLKGPGMNYMGRPSQGSDALAAKVLAAWQARKAEVGDIFADFVLERTRRDRQQQVEVSPLADEYVREEAAKGWDAGLAALEKLALIWLGEREKWAEFTKEPTVRQGNSIYGGGYRYPYHQAFANFLTRAGMDDKVVFMVADFVTGNQLNTNDIRSEGINRAVFNGDISRQPERIASLLFGGPLREPGVFRTYLVGSDETYPQSVMKRLLDYLRSGPDSNKQGREKLLGDLAGRKDFGAGLAAAYLQSDYGAAVAEYLGSRRAEIEKFQDRERQELVAFAAPLYRGALNPAYSAEARAVIDQLRAGAVQDQAGKADAFLASTKLGEEFNGNSYALYNKTIPLIHALTNSQARDKAIAVFWHTVDLVAKQQKDGSWEFSGDGLTFQSQFLYEVMRRDNELGPDRIGFFVHLVRQDAGKERLAIYDPNLDQILDYAFKQRGGDQDMPKALASLFTHLAAEVGENTPVSVLGPDLASWAGRFPEDRRIALVRWADGQSKGHPWSALARELAMAGRLNLASGSATTREKSLKEFPDLDAWKAHYLAVISDEKLGLLERVFIASGVNLQALLPGDPAFARQTAEITARTLNGGYMFRGSSLISLLAPFCRLERDAAWDATAQSLLKGWTYINRFNKVSPPTGQSFRPALNTSLAMLEVQAKLGEAAPLNPGSTEWKKGEMRALWACVQHGNFELARQFLEKGWKNANPDEFRNNTHRFAPSYSEAFQARLTAFLPTVENPGLRLLAEVQLSNMNDPRPEYKEAAGKIEPRQRRLTFISRRFDEVAFTDAEMKRRVLTILATEESAAVAVAKHIAEESAAMNLQTIAFQADQRNSLELIRIPLAHAMIEAKEGRGEALKKLTTTIAGTPNPQSGTENYNRGQLLESIGTRITDRVKRYGGHLEKAEAAVLAENLRLIITRADPNYYQPEMSFLLAHKITSVVGEVEDKAWLDGQVEARRRQVDSTLKSYSSSLWTSSAQMLQAASPKPATLERRLAVMLAISSDPAFQAAIDNRMEVFQVMESTKLLSTEEIVAHGDALATALPRKGWAALELAERHQKAGNLAAAKTWAAKAQELGPGNVTLKVRADAILKAVAP